MDLSMEVREVEEGTGMKGLLLTRRGVLWWIHRGSRDICLLRIRKKKFWFEVNWGKKSEIDTLKDRCAVDEAKSWGVTGESAAEILGELQGNAEEDRWKWPLLPHCSPQDTPFIPSLMMGWIYVFGSKSSDWMAESICYGVLLLFLGLWFYRNVTSGAGPRVKECTIRKW